MIKAMNTTNILMRSQLGKDSEERRRVNRPKEEYSRQREKQVQRPKRGNVIRNKES